MELAYFDKMAKDKNIVKYLLVRQCLFDVTVEANGMKTTGSRKMIRQFLTLVNKKNRPRRL